MSADHKTKNPFNAWLGGLFVLCSIISFFLVSGCASTDIYSDDPLYGSSETECEVDVSNISLLDLAVKTGGLMLFGLIAALSLQGLEQKKRNEYVIKLELELFDLQKRLEVQETPFRDKMSSMRGYVELDGVLFDRKADPERAFVDSRWISFPTKGAPWTSALEGEPLTEAESRERFPHAFSDLA